MGYEIHEFRGSYLSFVGEKWKHMPFMGKTRVLVPVPKVGTGTHGQRPIGTGTHGQRPSGTGTIVSGTGTHLQNRVGIGTDQSGTGTDASSSPDFCTHC